MKKLFVLLSVVLASLSINAETVELKKVVADAIAAAKDSVKAGNTAYNVVPVMLHPDVTYTLNEELALGTQDVRINGGGAIVVLSGKGQITTQGYLMVRCVGFDCTDNEVAPFAMDANPDASKAASTEEMQARYGCSRTLYFAEDPICIYGCAFSNLKTALFSKNDAPWAIKSLTLNNNVVQMNYEEGAPCIDLYGDGKCTENGIKSLVIKNNTFYNIAINNKSYFIRYANASNAQPQKVWPNDPTSSFDLLNNTFCQAMAGQNWANNYPSKNNVTLTFKNNIFYNTYRLQKIGGSCVLNFAATDNIVYSNLADYPVDATDKAKYGTEIDPGFTVPTTPLDLANVTGLAANFTPATGITIGDPSWAPVYEPKEKTAECNYQVISTQDMLIQKSYKGGTTTKPAIDDVNYPWFVYENASSTCDDGTPEVSVANAYTSYDLITGDYYENAADRKMLPATDGTWAGGYPKVEAEKTITFHMTGITKARLLMTGAGSNSNIANIHVYQSNGIEILALQTSDLKGKSQKAAQAVSEFIDVANLDMNEAYTFYITAESGTTQLVAIHAYGDDLTYNSNYFIPYEKYPGTNWQAVNFSNCLVTKTKDGANKFGISDDCPWLVFTDPGSTLDDGTSEVTRSGAYSTIDIYTGKAIASTDEYPNPWGGTIVGGMYVIDDAMTNCGSIKINGDAKTVDFYAKKVTKVAFVLTGGSSQSTNTIKLDVIDVATGETVQSLTSEAMANKSNKVANANGSVLTVSDLDPSKAYRFAFSRGENDVFILSALVTGTDLTVAPAASDAIANEIVSIPDDATPLIVAPVKYVNAKGQIVIGNYNIAGQRIK